MAWLGRNMVALLLYCILNPEHGQRRHQVAQLGFPRLWARQSIQHAWALGSLTPGDAQASTGIPQMKRLGIDHCLPHKAGIANRLQCGYGMLCHEGLGW